MSKYYVLARKRTPQGSQFEIESILRKESPDVKDIFDKHDIRTGSLIPSEDFSRFMAVHDVPIPPLILGLMQCELRGVGYRLEGPFTKNKADIYWKTGTLDAESVDYR